MKRWVKIIVGIIILIIIMSVAFLTNYIVSVKKYQNAVENITYSHSNALDIADGSYIGEYDVRFIYAKVKVTVENHRITDIALLEHRNGRGRTAERIVKEIVAQQKIDVDIIAGATNSSRVIKKAVDNALSNIP